MSCNARDLFNIRMDDAQEKTVKDAKVLIITFDLSSALRVTNNRIYTPKGQRDYAYTWTTPYKKPILVHHNRDKDPIGRFVDVKYVDNDLECMRFFDSAQEFVDFKRTAFGDNPQKIYKAMAKHGLLTNSEWPGIGKLVATARIADKDAIQKFLDERYLTFSAGSHTDRYACGQCGSDWATGDVCDHTPGRISDEGLPNFFVTGKFHGDEGSVEHMPGNALSQITSMAFGDSAGGCAPQQVISIDSNSLHFVDAIIKEGDSMSISESVLKAIEELKTMDARDVARAVFDGSFSQEQNDALGAKTHYETSWLIRVHDALHNQYDWSLRWKEDSSEIPEAVFALHADLHLMSEEKGFRDSIINGPLDKFDSKGEDSEEFVSSRASKDNSDGDSMLDVNTVKNAVALALADESVLSKIVSALREINGVQKTEEVEEVKDEQEEEVVANAPEFWARLDSLMTLSLGDSAISEEDRAALSEDKFCAERLVPVVDEAAVSLVTKLVDLAGLSDEEKTLALDVINAQSAAMADAKGSSCSCKEHESTIVSLNKDCAAALELSTSLQKEVDSLKEQLASLDTQTTKVENKGKAPNIDDVKEVPNPSASGSQSLKDSKGLDAFQKRIVSRYKELKDTRGEDVANAYLSNKIRSRHLPKNFDISSHIQENE